MSPNLKKTITLQLGSIFNIEHQMQEENENINEETVSYSPEWQRIVISQNEKLVLNTEDGTSNTSSDRQPTTEDKDQIDNIQLTATTVKDEQLMTKILKQKLPNNWNENTQKLLVQVI